MPVIPFGGLSFFLNVAIVILGSLFSFLKVRGFHLTFIRRFLSFFTAKKFDKELRQAFGYALMLTVFLFLFSAAAISFSKRFQTETNLDIINNAFSAYYQSSPKTIGGGSLTHNSL